MKFLIKSMGWDAFRKEVLSLEADLDVPLPFDPEDPPVEHAPEGHAAEPDPATIAQLVAASELRGPGIHPAIAPRLHEWSRAGFASWLATNVEEQKQPGFLVASATVPLGDLSGAQLMAVASLAEAFSDGTVRLTPSQNLVFRWVHADRLNRLYESLAAAGLGLNGARTAADVTSCPGAESCKLAVTQSRGLGEALANHMRRLPVIADNAPFDVKVSGCPNGCGQHHVAAVGFQGSLRKVDGRAAPQYFVTVGGGMHESGAAFGSLVAKVPARRAPAALARLVSLYVHERLAGETSTAFFARQDRTHLKALLADLESLDARTAQPEDFVDFAETGPFRPDMQEGECAV